MQICSTNKTMRPKTVHVQDMHRKGTLVTQSFFTQLAVNLFPTYSGLISVAFMVKTCTSEYIQA